MELANEANGFALTKNQRPMSEHEICTTIIPLLPLTEFWQVAKDKLEAKPMMSRAILITEIDQATFEAAQEVTC